MEKKSRLIKTLLIAIAALMIVTLIAVAAVVAGQRSDGGAPPEPEEEDQGEQLTPTPKVLSDYLILEDVPFFAPSYLDIVEQTYRRVYYKPEDIPDSEALAKEISVLYNEHLKDITDSDDVMAVTYALIDCLIEAIGDKYSFYRTREETLAYDSNMSGNFVGIGVEILRDNVENTILVEVVHIDSPAEGAGLLPGDYIVGVDGFSIDDIGAYALVNKIRGEVGAPLTVTVKRGDQIIDLEMVRAVLTESTVRLSYLADGRIANIRITGFKDNTAEQFIAAINEMEAAGAEAVVFDLRSNGGGYLSAAVNMISYLVPDDTLIVSFSNGRAPVFASSGTDLEPTDHCLTIPAAVVVNQNSASASELFTSALRDYNTMEILDVTVVGTITFKKGVMQSTYEYSDGSTLTLTISLYNPPSGINFDGVGVTPDVLVEEGEDALEKAQNTLEEKINKE